MYRGITRNPLMIILLSIVTCGIYGIYWLFVVSDEINQASGDKIIDPIIFFLVGLLLFPLFLIGIYKIDEALFELNTRRGLAANRNFLLWILLSFFFGIGNLFMMYQVQEQLNKLWAQP